MTRRIRLYADSADDAAVRSLLDEGLVVGVTTNPEILRASGARLADLPALVSGWIAAGAQEVFLQTWGETRDAMLDHARMLRDIAPQVAVKVPATEVGLGVAAALVADRATVLVTAVYEEHQALAAASVGARWIAPYLGRLDDAGHDGAARIGGMARIVAGTDTSVLAASIRSPQRLVDLALHGVDACTARPDVVRAALRSEPSDAATAAFEEAMRAVV
ncbi:transaldolase family protein [Agrococcus sp. SGAir0287]|uniref:transaldolase family protein n=1 Tax=Agrococcus sp. SGAir0287 TaxID=2070347 RepID=UPI0010CCE244|nr:transaldolase family protein [Agrococcus sp. SGAir0287]QCR18197.1 transaldolase [Agrococcus sp. SGAir0287]